MRISKAAWFGALGLALSLVLARAYAFDGSRSPDTPVMPAAADTLGAGAALAATEPAHGVTALTPVEAFRTGTHALKAGENAKALASLQYAADKGHALAQWKLGRMYAAGEGVGRNDLRAFEYFSRVADSHADDSPELPQARFVANAFVQLGHYYLSGIPNTEVKADAERAREMFAYAASYFGDADAQYSLARIYLDGIGTAKDPRRALPWLNLAANKGQYRAQALLGQMLCSGEHVIRQRARGLMWLTLARDNAGAGDKRIADMHAAAFQQASDDERALALVYLERWLKGQRE
jgi:TPR repeat protein